MSKYAIFKNQKGQSLVYYPCAKNANSSAKLFFMKHSSKEDKVFFIDDIVPIYKKNLYHKIEQKNSDKVNLIGVMPSYQSFNKINTDFKCCIIREPIKRFLSAYKNRILYHQDQKFRDYSIDMILDRLAQKKFDNKHFLPQHYFLGNDLKYYSFYADLSNIILFEQKVNEFFGKYIEFPRLQIGGNNININLSNQQINLLKKIYHKDFELYESKDSP